MPADKPIDYRECPWGESIGGTKAQLQSLELGVGLAFPGEPGGPPRQAFMNLFDPRGFRTTIQRWSGDGDDQFLAGIHYPDRTTRPDLSALKWRSGFKGVEFHKWLWADEYTGTSESLIAAGLVPAGCFPGDPGMRKITVRLFPDGTLASAGDRSLGVKCIERASKTTFSVLIRIDDEEEERRREGERAAERAWEREMRLLPRPPKLKPGRAGSSAASG